jgi:hypothetical protein
VDFGALAVSRVLATRRDSAGDMSAITKRASSRKDEPLASGCASFGRLIHTIFVAPLVLFTSRTVVGESSSEARHGIVGTGVL